jgi:hypothetical protein
MQSTKVNIGKDVLNSDSLGIQPNKVATNRASKWFFGSIGDNQVVLW